MKRAHYFKHVPFEGLGAIEPWLEHAGYSISKTEFHADAALPEIDAIDLLIVMGGPMSVNDEERYPWLSSEMAFIRNYIAQSKPILGICLGAQLIAKAMGATVYKNPQREIGWFSVDPMPLSSAENFQFKTAFQAFHWHGETFDLPESAHWLASSAACLHQAFSIGTTAIGLQFHMETTPASAAALISHCSDELILETYVQSAEVIQSASENDYACIHSQLHTLLAYLTASEISKV